MAISSKKQETHHYPLSEASRVLGFEPEFLMHCIEAHWLIPAVPTGPLLDDEDLGRAQLIHDLQFDFGANDEAIPIILHLIDQLYYLQSRLAEISPVRILK